MLLVQVDLPIKSIELECIDGQYCVSRLNHILTFNVNLRFLTSRGSRRLASTSDW